MRHYLVVANQTLKQPELLEKIRACNDAGPCDFFLLVPATRSHGPLRWTPADAVAVARRRLDSALERFRALGADVVGDVGDPSPVVAIGELLRRRPFDALILSTLPVGPSQWLRLDVPARIQQLFNIPVELVTPPSDTKIDRPAAGTPAADVDVDVDVDVEIDVEVEVDLEVDVDVEVAATTATGRRTNQGAVATQ